MSKTDYITENQIKKHAKELFFNKGMLDATTQEIADFANVNRTSINYYFRSKEKLFEQVYLETVDEMRQNYNLIYISEVPFREKIEQIIDYTIDFRTKYPFLEVFNIQETAKISNNKSTILNPTWMKETNLFLQEIALEMRKGTIKKSDPINFYINLISLIAFPIIMKPIFLSVFYINSEEEYKTILEERRALVLSLLFND